MRTYFVILILFYIAAEETPDRTACVDVVLRPGMGASGHFIKPYFVAVLPALEHMGYDLPAPVIKRVGLFMGTAVHRRPVAHRKRHGYVLAPSSLVLRVPMPHGRAVRSAVYLHQRDRLLCLQVPVHPLEGKSGQRREGRKDIRPQIGEQVAHLSAVGYARAEYIPPVKPVPVRHMTGKGTQEPDIIGLKTFLEGISYIPARLSARILLPLGKTGREPILAGHIAHHVPVRRCLSSIAVKHDDKRRALGKAVRDNKPVVPFRPLVPVSEQAVPVKTPFSGISPDSGNCRKQYSRQQQSHNNASHIYSLDTVSPCGPPWRWRHNKAVWQVSLWPLLRMYMQPI